MTSSEVKTAVRDYLQGIVSPVLIAAPGLTDFDDYLDENIYESTARALAVYLADGSDTELEQSEVLLIKCQLPEELYPDKYHDVVKQAIKDFRPTSVGMTTKNFTWHVFYPGEAPEGGGSAFIYYELALARSLDDCN
jgi:hypothetical protein